ncbi:bifunctional adenosylcobinamide kinase/adenosylcobinamide-phosphate guanylyltransferase [Lipingzhangella sp. LS1_29]|uniref:Adenosylcobinamide kinase n=1 Tax=Lipingzhangella rawalii TaxID=2055835 RepID=A0ABU2H2H8_9ACTN|nr:bifunctional adenosylcobinamide kinase/adenosylcobinamide-phosphate guanylyltransferase [Lipingzhangella rawalii]MDS1269498.1 bifunctional adenosylcobinamide kinase/adenosylcobinamide-phosphate guanylyltransferase [Lipingzhangella rawalii]
MTVDDTFVLPDPASHSVPRVPDGYTVEPIDHGTLVCGPEGDRLLYAHASPVCAAADQVDMVLVDVVTSPSVTGALRRCGVVGTSTAVIGLGGDHRVPSPQELERRGRMWGALIASDNQELRCPPTAWPPPRTRGPRRTLVLGGARSGKSAEAELRLQAEPEVTYVATGPLPSADDPAWQQRVALHRQRRPDWWRTEETLDVAGLLATSTGAILLDGLGSWLAATMDNCGIWREETGPNAVGAGAPPPEAATAEVWRRVEELAEAWRQTRANVVAVSDEVGWGVVPATASGGLFRDWLGRLNERLAHESEEVLLTVAGRVLELS